jgi:hypothetical protein
MYLLLFKELVAEKSRSKLILMGIEKPVNTHNLLLSTWNGMLFK